METGGDHFVSVALVDDEPCALQFLQRLMAGVPRLRSVAACGSPAEALGTLPAVRPQIVLMDIRMPGRSGIDCAHELKRFLPQSLVIMVTVLADLGAVFDALQAGARGYLTKAALACRPARCPLGEAIQIALCGGVSISADLRHCPQPHRLPPAVNVMLPVLRPREELLWGELAQGKPDKMISSDLGISDNQLKEVKRSLFAKLGVRTRAEAMLKYFQCHPFPWGAMPPARRQKQPHP